MISQEQSSTIELTTSAGEESMTSAYVGGDGETFLIY